MGPVRFQTEPNRTEPTRLGSNFLKSRSVRFGSVRKKCEPISFKTDTLMQCSKRHDHFINTYNSTNHQPWSKTFFYLKEGISKLLFSKTKFINTVETVALLATTQNLGFILISKTICTVCLRYLFECFSLLWTSDHSNLSPWLYKHLL